MTDILPESTKLLTCPFCGGEPTTYEGRFASSVKCDNGHAIHEYKPTLAEAKAAWNTRVSAPATIDRNAVGAVFDLDGIKELWRTGVETGRILERYDAPTPTVLINTAVEEAARRLAASDGLNFDEACGYEVELEECKSSTCVAANFEDHDADHARSVYAKYARAIITPEQQSDVEDTQP